MTNDEPITAEQVDAVLALSMPENEVNADTIRDYLVALLAALWDEGEGFSGKRPLGESGWKSRLLAPLVAAGMIDGALDDEGYLEYDDHYRPVVDRLNGWRLIAAAIQRLGVS